ncbi:MAG TPA: orotidine-5'-phosphate decarboxylase [Actinomycetota bacterium]|nr:orotidine-5'-phosphate decarboxylase [Actinomycetota bacterium]
MIPPPNNPLIAAIDVSDIGRAEGLARSLQGRVGLLKAGLELIWAHGPEAVRRLAVHGPVFVDAKLHDIPTTVERASANIARLGVAMLNVHALGGEAMVEAAVRGARRGSEEAGDPMPLVLAVTVLSSLDESLASPASLAYEAKSAGADGAVVSGEDVRVVREVVGEEFCLVVPGIRPTGSNGHDHARILTPAEAIDAGADYLVVGRLVTGASDPAAAATAILAEIR